MKGINTEKGRIRLPPKTLLPADNARKTGQNSRRTPRTDGKSTSRRLFSPADTPFPDAGIPRSLPGERTDVRSGKSPFFPRRPYGRRTRSRIRCPQTLPPVRKAPLLPRRTI